MKDKVSMKQNLFKPHVVVSADFSKVISLLRFCFGSVCLSNCAIVFSLFLISSFGTTGRLCFVLVTFPG